jgi:hypothetical protein
MALGLTQPLTETSEGKVHPITGQQGPRGGLEI